METRITLGIYLGPKMGLEQKAREPSDGFLCVSKLISQWQGGVVGTRATPCPLSRERWSWRLRSVGGRGSADGDPGICCDISYYIVKLDRRNSPAKTELSLTF